MSIDLTTISRVYYADHCEVNTLVPTRVVKEHRVRVVDCKQPVWRILRVEVIRVHRNKSRKEPDLPSSGILVRNARDEILSSCDGVVGRKKAKFYHVPDASIQVVGAESIL